MIMHHDLGLRMNANWRYEANKHSKQTRRSNKQIHDRAKKTQARETTEARLEFVSFVLDVA
jgi:hypothetical protein